MKKGTEPPNRYVEKVRDSARQFAKDLLQENVRLGDQVASLEGERQRLHEEMFLLREQINLHLQTQSRLQQQLAENEAQRSSFAMRYLDVEAQNANLASLYVTTYRLHSTLERQGVLDIIQEIIINLIGSEEMAIFEMDEDGRALRLVEFFGIDPEAYACVPLGAGTIGRAALSGELHIAEKPAGDLVGDADRVLACIPLKLGGRVTGLIAIFSLLGQKAGIEPLDRELFDLLATHAATALHCTSLYAAEPLGMI